MSLHVLLANIGGVRPVEEANGEKHDYSPGDYPSRSKVLVDIVCWERKQCDGYSLLGADRLPKRDSLEI